MYSKDIVFVECVRKGRVLA